MRIFLYIFAIQGIFVISYLSYRYGSSLLKRLVFNSLMKYKNNEVVNLSKYRKVDKAHKLLSKIA